GANRARAAAGPCCGGGGAGPDAARRRPPCRRRADPGTGGRHGRLPVPQPQPPSVLGGRLSGQEAGARRAPPGLAPAGTSPAQGPRVRGGPVDCPPLGQLPGGTLPRSARRRGKGRATLAVAHAVLVALSHMLRDPVPDSDLGADSFDRWDTERLQRRYVQRLQQLGYTVTLTPAPAA